MQVTWRETFCDTWEEGYRAFFLEPTLCHIDVEIEYWKGEGKYRWHVYNECTKVATGKAKTKRGAKRKAIRAYNRYLWKHLV
jgi:hypothetical protein